jgi:hypothetical protein
MFKGVKDIYVKMENNSHENLIMDVVNKWKITPSFSYTVSRKTLTSEQNTDYKNLIIRFIRKKRKKTTNTVQESITDTPFKHVKNITDDDYVKSKAKLYFSIWLFELSKTIMTKIAQCGKIYLSSNDPSTKENFNNGFERIRPKQNTAPTPAPVKNVVKKKRMTFISKCPANGCNGLINEKYTCQLCNTVVCNKCMDIIGVKELGKKLPEHECNPDTLASAKLIKADTKPCPKCSARIFKISGCDQMWCTNCNVAFCWRTGFVIKSRIHNPHYFNWLNKKGRNNTQNTVRNRQNRVNVTPSEVVCGTIPNTVHFRDKLCNPYFKSACQYYWVNGKNREIIDMFENVNVFIEWIQSYWLDIVRLALHVQDVDIRYMRNMVNTEMYDFKPELKNYVLKKGNLSDKEFKLKIYNYNVTRETQQNLLDIYEMLSAITNESLAEVYNMIPLTKTQNFGGLKIEQILEHYNRVNSVILYANKELTKTGALKKRSTKEYRFKTIKKNETILVMGVTSPAGNGTWGIPTKTDVKKKQNILDFSFYDLYRTESCKRLGKLIGRSDIGRLNLNENNILEIKNKLTSLNLNNECANFVYLKLCKFYSDKIKEIKEGKKTYNYVWSPVHVGKIEGYTYGCVKDNKFGYDHIWIFFNRS